MQVASREMKIVTDQRIRAIQYGCGKMSIHTMQFMLDHGVDIVGALDINPHVVGKDIGEIIGGEARGVVVTDASKKWLADHGFDPIYGARPLRRLVQKEIGDQLARAILSGDVLDGDLTTVDEVNDRLVLV